MKQTPEGRRLTEAREAAGLPLDDAAYLARQQIAHVKCSRETLRAYESTVEETRWTAEVVLALAAVYGVSLVSLSPIAAERLSNVLALYAPRDSNPEPSDSPQVELPAAA